MAFFQREVGLAIAATAAALSPKARRVARQGAVYGLAGAMKAADVVAAAARGAQEGLSGEEPEAAPKPRRKPPAKRARSRSGTSTSRKRGGSKETA